jgi:hypothetical protein
MNPVVYKCSGAVMSRYVPGVYRWGVPVRLSCVRVTCCPPKAGVLRLRVEAGGVVVASVGVAAARLPEVTVDAPAAALVAAGTELRVRAEFAGVEADAATALSVTLHGVAQGIWEAAQRSPELTLEYAERGFRAVVGAYDPETATWSTLPSPLAAVTQAGQSAVSFYLRNVTGPTVEVLRVASGTVWVRGEFKTGGAAIPGALPRLRFCIDGVAIASLTAEGDLWAADLLEEAAATEPEWDRAPRFELYSTGQLTARLAAGGLCAKALEEGLP